MSKQKIKELGEDPEKFYWFNKDKSLFKATSDAFCESPITEEQKETIKAKTIELFKKKDGKKTYTDMLKDFAITTARHLTSGLADLFIVKLEHKININ